MHNAQHHFSWRKIKFERNISQHTKLCNCIKLQQNRSIDRVARHAHDENLKMIDIVEFARATSSSFITHIHPLDFSYCLWCTSLDYGICKKLDLRENLIYFSFHKLGCIVASSRYEIVQSVDYYRKHTFSPKRCHAIRYATCNRVDCQYCILCRVQNIYVSVYS